MVNRLRPLIFHSKTPTTSFPFSTSPNHPTTSPLSSATTTTTTQNPPPKTLIGSPARVQKLIASQTDPLLAKEIFDLASKQPNFRHSYSSYHTLIRKLGKSRHFSLMHSLLLRLKSRHYPVTPGLFTDIIQIYGDANLPDKALNTFHIMLEFDCKPLPRHLNRLLEVLVAHRSYIRPAYDLFKTAVTKFGIVPNAKTYNILMRAFCLNGDLSVAYTLFNKMFEREILPDVETYRILMQALCRKSQVGKAVDLLEDMLNKGYVPDTVSYTTLLNSLCRKKKLREAYKLLCRMKVKGCNPDIVHYNTVILGFVRERRAPDAIKVIEDMPENGCLPNLVSYRTLVNGLCNEGMLDEANHYLEEMISKGFAPHFSAFHALIKGFCNVGKMEEACGVLEEMLRHAEVPHTETWMAIIPRICNEYESAVLENIWREVLKKEITRDTRIVDIGPGLEEYIIKRIKAKAWKT